MHPLSQVSNILLKCPYSQISNVFPILHLVYLQKKGLFIHRYTLADTHTHINMYVTYMYIYAIMKTMCPPDLATHAFEHIMYGCTLLVPINQRVLNNPSKEHNIISHKWSMTHRVLKSHRSKMSISLLGLLSTLWFIGTSNVYPYIMCLSAWVAIKQLWRWHIYMYI